MLNPTRFLSRFNHATLPALRSGATAPDVLQLQQLLQDKGFDPGAIDGHLGGLRNEDLIRSIICGLGILPGIKQPRRLFHII
jgi:hypothetical protein